MRTFILLTIASIVLAILMIVFLDWLHWRMYM